MPQDTDVTRLLLAWSEGRQEAVAAPLMDAVYDELRRLARGYLLRERRDHSLPATALVHEAYLKLVDQRRVRWQNRAHFFAVASQVMRRLLVDHARARGAVEAGRASSRFRSTASTWRARARAPDLIALDSALEKLAALDPRQARLVELRFFGGLTIDEAAAVLDVAAITVKRDWATGPDLAVSRAGWIGMTAPGDWERVKQLFHEALDVAPDARVAFVKARADDPRVFEEVMSLLQAYPAAEGFLSTPPDPARMCGGRRAPSAGRPSSVRSGSPA